MPVTMNLQLFQMPQCDCYCWSCFGVSSCSSAQDKSVHPELFAQFTASLAQGFAGQQQHSNNVMQEISGRGFKIPAKPSPSLPQPKK